MKLEYRIVGATGPRPADCHFILQRWNPQNEEFECESFIMQALDNQVTAVIGTLGFYKDIWRSPSGAVFVAGGMSIHWSHNPVQHGGKWDEIHNITAYRVWGLSDELVFVYGDPIKKQMYRYDGSSWETIAAPRLVNDIHGISSDIIYAAGAQGIAKYNGEGWDQIPLNTRRAFTSIHVVSENEIYAILAREQVWKGSLKGWAPITEKRGYPVLTCVTKWNNKIWVGDKYSGLSVVQGNKLEVVKEKLKLQSMVAGEMLTITHSYGISGSEDGKKFSGFKIDNLINIMKTQKPVWL